MLTANTLERRKEVQPQICEESPPEPRGFDVTTKFGLGI